MRKLALRVGLKPWELRRVTPRDVYDMAEAWQWRHNLWMRVVATAVFTIAKPDYKPGFTLRSVLHSMPGYSEPKKKKEAEEGQGS